MKKITISIIMLILVFRCAYSQQLPLYSQYLFNGFLLNPAISGTKDYIPVTLTGRLQYIGFEGAPRTYVLSAHSPISGGQMGLGGSIFRDQIGAVSETGLQIAYSYHIPLNESINMSLGLGVRAYQYVYDESQLSYIEEDPTITNTVISTFVPDADLGVYVYSEKWFLSLSAAQLIQYKVKLGSVDVSSSNNTNKRHYFVTGGYMLPIGDDIEIEPSLLIKGTATTPLNIDVNVRAIYRKNYWLGLSYRTDKTLITILGIKNQNYLIGIAYDYSLSDIRSYTTGSFELVLRVVNLGEYTNNSSKLL
jgi:type IX secretion system PorP/SprF family membrane protein